MTPWTARDTFDVLRIGSLKHFLRRLAGPAPLAPASPAAGPASPRALAGRPARRPRPPARPAARRRAGAHGLDRHRCWGGTISKGILHAFQRGFYTLKGVRDTSAASTSPPRPRATS
jgi:pyruvate/2-oxoglutarate dehydrogenase complex dihydrolipoamide acyltransferase (E2) component